MFLLRLLETLVNEFLSALRGPSFSVIKHTRPPLLIAENERRKRLYRTVLSFENIMPARQWDERHRD